MSEAAAANPAQPVAVKTYADFLLPPIVVTRIDLTHLVHELERIDVELTTASVRTKAGSPVQEMPRVSESLAAFINLNKLIVDTPSARSELIKQMRLLKDRAPTVHMTFATEADSESLHQLAEWLRASVHPQAVIAVGLQPGLLAGVHIRTPNHVHDFSLRASLSSGRGLLIKELEALRAGK